MDVETFLLFQNQQIIDTLGSHQIVWQNWTLFNFSVYIKKNPIQNSSIQNSPKKHEIYKKAVKHKTVRIMVAAWR